MAHMGEVFEGKTLDAAVKRGLETLGLSRAEVMIKTIQEGSSGFLGIGARPYRVQVMRRPGGPPPVDQDRDERRRRGPGRERRERERGRGDRDGRPREAGRGPGERHDQPRERGEARRRDERRDVAPPSGGSGRAAEAGRRDERRRDEGRGEPRDERSRDRRGPGAPEPAGQGGRQAERRDRDRGGRPREERRDEWRDAAGPPVREPAFGEREDARRRDEPAAEPEPRRPVLDGVPDGGEEDEARRRRRRGRRGGRRRHGAPDESVAFAAGASPLAATGPDGPVDEGNGSGPEEEESFAAAPAARPRDGTAAEAAVTPAPPAVPPSDAPREPRAAAAEGPGLGSEELAAESVRLTRELLDAMGFEAKVGATVDGDHVDVTAEVARDEELLTGPKGEVRQALQHILNRRLNRGESSRYHLQLEINDFWKRREEELCGLARSLAEEALASGGEAVTEYLNAQERRIVHVTLRDDTRVKTYALGTGMIKRVAIAPADFAGGPRDEED